jgi:hypothetical protein
VAWVLRPTRALVLGGMRDVGCRVCVQTRHPIRTSARPSDKVKVANCPIPSPEIEYILTCRIRILNVLSDICSSVRH